MRAVAVLLLALAGSCRSPEAAATARGLLVFVRAAGDVPVPGARVDLFAGPPDREYDDYDALEFRPSADPPPVLSTAVTGREGAVAFDLPPPGRYWLSAVAEGFGRETVGTTVVEGSAPPEIAVFLVPGSPLSGTITGDESEPLSGVEVIAAPTCQCRVWPCDAACDRATTDSKGRFRFGTLAPGDYGIWYRPESGVLVGAGTVRAPLVTHLPIRAYRGGVVAGVVRDAETGAPLEGAVVRVLDSWPEQATVVVAEARTNHAGRFEAATHRAICDVKGFAVALRGYAPTPVGELTLLEHFSNGQRLDLDLALAKEATLRGRVLGPSGPVGGIRVSCTQEDFDHRAIDVTSDADGEYRFADLDAGPYCLLVELTPRNEERFDVDVAAGADHVHDLRLDDLRLSDIKGRVIDMEGNPVPGARVWSGDGPRRAETRTDAQGRFALRIWTLHGVADITADAPGSNFLRGHDWLDIANGDVEIRLIRGAGIRGSVRAADGSPVAGARIAAGAWVMMPTTSTLPFDFDSLCEGVTAPDGSYEFRPACAWSADFLRAWSPVDGALVDTWSGVDEGAVWRFDASFPGPGWSREEPCFRDRAAGSRGSPCRS